MHATPPEERSPVGTAGMLAAERYPPMMYIEIAPPTDPTRSCRKGEKVSQQIERDEGKNSKLTIPRRPK